MNKKMPTMTYKYVLLCILSMFISLAGASAKKGTIYNIKEFGAVGDGKAIDSPAINKAIEEAASRGGGTIFFPAGTYASYSIRLKSNISLYFDNGSVLLAAYPEKDKGYDVAEPNPHNQYQDFGHSHWKNSLIWGIGLENIQITGPGLINGQGLTREESRLPGVGNKAISLKLCRNVIISDISMLNCGHFALLATGVDNLTISNVKVDTNRDGFDIDCCRNVRISDCSINSPWDDAIVLKSSYALGFFRDTEKVIITNCLVSGYDRGSLLDATYQRLEPQAPDQGFVTGRIKLGTESSGGFKNITISNCVFERCRGIALETVDGGYLEDIVINGITMRDIVNAPIFLRLGSRMRSPEGTPVGKMRRITLSNINVYNADSRYASIISGIPGYMVEDVTLSNIRIVYKGGGTKDDAALVPPENEKLYPEPWMFGTIPASAFFIRHAKNINLDNISISFLSKDERPLIWAHNVDKLKVDGLDAPVSGSTQPFHLSEVKQFKVVNSDIEAKNGQNTLSHIDSKKNTSQDEVYLFSYFTGNGNGGLHLAYSFDGLKWEALNEGKPLLAPKIGKDRLMRDPSIARGKDGIFHMVWTTGWWDKHIGYASSPDLVNWSEQRIIPVMEHEPKTRNCWAPEVFYDDKKDLFHIIWASTIPGRFPELPTSESEKGLNHRQYRVTTRDFKTFSDTELFFDPGFSVIDAAIIRKDNLYWMIVKNENSAPAEKNLRITFSDDLRKGFPSKVSNNISGKQWAEGPSPIQIGEYVNVYFDKYIDKKYGAIRSKDGKHWEDISNLVSFPKGTRHGTAFKITAEEFKQLQDLINHANKR